MTLEERSRTYECGCRTREGEGGRVAVLVVACDRHEPLAKAIEATYATPAADDASD